MPPRTVWTITITVSITVFIIRTAFKGTLNPKRRSHILNPYFKGTLKESLQKHTIAITVNTMVIIVRIPFKVVFWLLKYGPQTSSIMVIIIRIPF